MLHQLFILQQLLEALSVQAVLPVHARKFAYSVPLFETRHGLLELLIDNVSQVSLRLLSLKKRFSGDFSIALGLPEEVVEGFIV